MAVHDWTRVDAGIFHDFHNAWVTMLSRALNEGILPENLYCLGEQMPGEIGPDLLMKVATPRINIVSSNEKMAYASKQRTVVIRQCTNHRIIALLEIPSSCIKGNGIEIGRFLKKAMSALRQGIHVLIVDLYPPTARDRQGIHGLIWKEWMGGKYQRPSDKPLTLASYAVEECTTGYVEPLAVGDDLIDMPLFLDPEYYVNCPLEKTYQEAYRGVPNRWKKVLEQQP